MDTASSSRSHGLIHLLRKQPALRGFVVIRAADEIATQVLNVAIGWYIYAATASPLSLAYVGLAQFLPGVAVALLAGQAADRFDRRKVVMLSLSIEAICLAAFTAHAAIAAPSAAPVYILLVLVASARTFAAPALSATLPRLVGGDDFPRAVAVTTSVFQISAIAGPAIGGIIYAMSGTAAFAAATALYLLATVAARRLAAPGASTGDAQLTSSDPPVATNDKGALAGLRYLGANRLLLGLVSLDLFAVLLGGVTALLPIYARDILAAGPIGLGVLRCAPSVGAAVVGLILARHTIEHGAGRLMLACVAGFGLAIVVFAVSADLWLSLVALAAAGGFDMVSMVIRQTLVQIATPDEMRGRVSAVYWVFVSASSELGEFESGLTAALFGTVPAALIGGLATIAIVALWAKFFPEIRRADALAAMHSSTRAPAPERPP